MINLYNPNDSQIKTKDINGHKIGINQELELGQEVKTLNIKGFKADLNIKQDNLKWDEDQEIKPCSGKKKVPTSSSIFTSTPFRENGLF
jgi:hypothetical protein